MTGRSAGLNNNMEHDQFRSPDGETRLDFGEDDENMVSSDKEIPRRGYAFNAYGENSARDKHLRYRTRVFAAECLSHLPTAVGKNPAHFDLCLARKKSADGKAYGDWLVLHLQELISLAYQISTIQFENMQPIGVGLLSAIMDKFGKVPDPELPGHLLLEQYQAQLVSAVRTALDMSSGPILLEAGLRLATKILTSGIISGDQVAVRRIFSLISRPLNDFNDLYYPSFAEWVSCKIKVRLLAAHASLKCYTYAFLRRCHNGVPDEYLALLPLFSKSSNTLGKYWICVLKDCGYTCFRLHLNKNWKPFLDGIQSSLVSSKLRSCLEEAWPVILQAVALDAVPVNLDVNESSKSPVEDISKSTSISGYSMVKLELEDFRFLWGFALIVLFQRQLAPGAHIIIPGSDEAKFSEDSPDDEMNPISLKLHDIVLPVFQFLSTEMFFSSGFLTMNICEELLQVFSFSTHMEASWSSLAVSVLLQIVQNCPEDFLEEGNFAFLATELCLAYLFKSFNSIHATKPEHQNWEGLISPLFTTAKALVTRFKPMKQLNLLSAFLLIGYKCIRGASTELCFSKVTDYVHYISSLLKKHVNENFETDDNIVDSFNKILGGCLNVISTLTKDCVKGIHKVENIRSDLSKLLQMKLAFSIEQIITFAKLAHEIGFQVAIKEHDTTYFTILKSCTECIQKVLTDSNTQTIAITLQVLKNMAQRSTNVENNSFLMFFIGELFADIFTILQQMLKQPITRESVTVAGECLRTLVLLQTLSKPRECQKGLMNLLLGAILFVFCVSENDCSQELIDIRSIAVRLVSHLAQIPSSAVHFKDVLLAMPITHREQLQGIIRASVVQDQNETQNKSTAPSLTIKLPMQTEKNTEEISSPSPTTHTDQNSIDEEEDDWDSFQSFPASTEPATINSEIKNAPEEPTSATNSFVSDANTKNDYFQEYSSSSPSNGMQEIDVEHQLAVEEQALAESAGGTTDMEQREFSDFQSSHSDNQLRDNHSEDRDDGALASQENDYQVSTDLHPVEDDERLDEVKLVHIGKIEEIPADTSDVQASSDPLSLKMLSASAGGTNEIKEFSDSQYSHSDMEPCDNHSEDRDGGAVVSQENDHQVSTDLHPVEDNERLNELKVVHTGQSEEIPGDTSALHAPPDSSSLEVCDYEHLVKAGDRAVMDLQHAESADKDAVEKLSAEEESNHAHKESGDVSRSLDSQDDRANPKLLSEIDRK